MIELEKTYLAKFLPEGLFDHPSREIIDIFIPESFQHPKIRIRKNGNKFEITKKEPVADDPSHMLEQTINITEDEFNSFYETIPGKRTRKIRYYYDHNGQTAQFDIFQDNLKGLALIDFEFENHGEKASFSMPDFCLVEVTKEQFIAGGMVCGKKYSDLEKELKRFKYKKLS